MDNQTVASTSSPKSAVQSLKISWPDESSIQQNFSLPFSIIYYISKIPPNPTVYLKLAQSCKYFFEKLPLLIAYDFAEENDKGRICSNTEQECRKKKFKCCVTLDLNKMKSKLWLTHKILAVENANNPNFISMLSSKIYQSDITQFIIRKQNVLFDDFKFIASSVTRIFMSDVKIVYANGNNVMLDGMLEALPNIEKFEIFCNDSMFDSSTLKNISKLKNLSKLRSVLLHDIPDIKIVEDILIVAKVFKHAKFELYFGRNISEILKNQLNAIIDTVIENGTSNCFILHNGQDAEKLKILISLICL